MKGLTVLLGMLGAIPVIATLYLAINWYGFHLFSLKAAEILLISNSLIIGAALVAIPLFIYQDIRGKQP